MMVGKDTKSYGHDHYFTAWNTGEHFCVGARVVSRKMWKVADGHFDVQTFQNSSKICMHSCGERESNNSVTRMYYEQKWDEGSKIVKYIKFGIKPDDGNGGDENSGTGSGDGNDGDGKDGNGKDGNSGDGVDDGNGGDNNSGNLVQSKAAFVFAFITMALVFGIANK